MTTSKNVPQWEHYLSSRFLALVRFGRKGIVWCLRTGIYRLFQRIFGRIYTCLLSVLSYELYLMDVKFLPIRIDRIGHLAVEPDCYLKEGILGLRPSYFEIVLAPTHQVANKHLLDYWRQHLRIVTSPILCSFLYPLSQQNTLKYDTYRFASVINETAHAFTIQTKYDGKPPLLTLRESDRQRGWDCLQKIGIPEGTWFVCVHSRDEGYVPGEGQTYRNANINNYLLAMEAIVERGGWCIHMGDLTIKSLPSMEHVIDYAHLSIKSDWMDVFLCASCKFFLGSESGLVALADVFGVSAGIANRAPMSVVFPCSSSSVGIPKLIWSLREERYLSFKEVFSSPIGNFRFDYLYSEAEVQTVENSPEDIRDLVLEMLERTEGTVTYTAEDERLQERFISLLKPGHYSYGASSRVGRDFLRKYARGEN